jgi:serine/threonine protein kinase
MKGFEALVSINYIHRDIKPANSLIKDGMHKIADFGFAVRIDTVKSERVLKE